MTTISKFTYALGAIEDATWRSIKYQEPYAVIELEGDFGVCSFDNLEPYDNILEICTPTKSKLTVENESFKAPEAVRRRDYDD
tara:strand:- start:3652 stop:3900 length:249 start_codon:yes stop_codon:yes gene_type:complete